MDARPEPQPDAPSAEPRSRNAGPDLATIALLVYFIALIGIVAILLLLPLLNG